MGYVINDSSKNLFDLRRVRNFSRFMMRVNAGVYYHSKKYKRIVKRGDSSKNMNRSRVNEYLGT
jgi:hypothetical protein